jgi:hypothetical protein
LSLSLKVSACELRGKSTTFFNTANIFEKNFLSL